MRFKIIIKSRSTQTIFATHALFSTNRLKNAGSSLAVLRCVTAVTDGQTDNTAAMDNSVRYECFSYVTNTICR